ncbi:MAG: hypothetical protein HN904_27635, partial [Victivallales bacterium]|nr:hypothetical protein [Victivallales bacterium]
TIETDAEGKVSLWRDKSGKDRHAEQKQAVNRPQFVQEGLNGLPSLRFHEKDATRLELPDLSQEKITATIFAVFSNPKAGLEVNHDARLFTASDGKGYDYKVGLAASIPGVQTGGPRQSMHVFKDRWAKQVRVGCFSPNVQTFFTGELAEILVFDRQLDAKEITRIRAYLASKWRLR